MSDERRGVWFGATAYLLWGAFPLFWPLLEPADPFQILAHRMVWSFVFVLAIVAAQRHFTGLIATIRNPRRLALLTAAAAVVSVNWFVYIYGVNNGHVVETSLGYFINPLVTVLLGVVVLKERLRPFQWLAVAVATLAVVVLAIDYGKLPWIALTLAVSFGSYGLIKKTVGVVPAVEGLAVESGVLFLPALTVLVVYEARGTGTFGHAGTANVLLLMSAGAVTAIPLIFFAASARRVPLVTLGLLQYIAPILQFGVGVAIRHEAMPPARWAGFALVWVALTLFTYDQLRAARARRVSLLGPPRGRTDSPETAVLECLEAEQGPPAHRQPTV